MEYMVFQTYARALSPRGVPCDAGGPKAFRFLSGVFAPRARLCAAGSRRGFRAFCALVRARERRSDRVRPECIKHALGCSLTDGIGTPDPNPKHLVNRWS